MRIHLAIGYAIAVAGLVMAHLTTFAAATDYPSKPIRMVIGQQAGSALDNSVRAITPALSRALATQIVLDNRPGAGGMIAMQIGNEAVADGYTIINAGSPQMIAPFIFKKLDYDLFRDFVAISRLTTVQNCLVANPGFKPGNVGELMELARSKPGAVNMASAGVGSASHLAGALFVAMTGAQVLHVPYKGGASAVTALISNEAQFMITPLSASMPHIRAGRLKILASGGQARAPQLPEVPTMQEQGVKNFLSIGWNGIFAPKGMPAANVTRIVSALTSVMAMPDTQERIVRAGVEPGLLTGNAFTKFMHEDMARFGSAVKAANLKAR